MMIPRNSKTTFISLVPFLLFLLIISVMIILFFTLRHSRSSSNEGFKNSPSSSSSPSHPPTIQSQYTGHYSSIQKVMADFMSYSVREARPQTYFSTSNFTLVGDDMNEITDMSESSQNDGNGRKIPLAVSVFSSLRTRILEDLIRYVHHRNEFVIIFDRPEFQGKMYLIPATRSHKWNSSVFKPMQYEPHPSFLEMERVKNVKDVDKVEKIERVEKVEEMKEMIGDAVETFDTFEPFVNIEMYEDEDKIEVPLPSPPSPLTPLPSPPPPPPLTPSSSPTPPSSFKPHMPLDTFISKFQLYYGRKFSCIVPKDVMLEFIPIQKEAKSSEPMIIREGEHDLVTYYLSPLLRFSVHKKSTRERDGF